MTLRQGMNTAMIVACVWGEGGVRGKSKSAANALCSHPHARSQSTIPTIRISDRHEPEWVSECVCVFVAYLSNKLILCALC